MHFTELLNQTERLGFNLVSQYNVYARPYNLETGWLLNLPEFVPGATSLLILHFPDFVTIQDGKVLELDRIEKFYGDHLDQILVTYWTSDLDKVYNGPINLIKFSNHNYDLCSDLLRRTTEWSHILSMPKTNAWQCLNGRTCPHRLRVANVLKTWENGVLSYGTEIPLPAWDYSRYRGCENDDNFIALDYVYGSCAVNIVTETEYEPITGIVTEKTLFAFAAEQIPVVIGHQGIVQHCRDLGFDMFDDVVNTTYDTMPNNVRAEQALLLNKNLIEGRVDLNMYKNRLEKNREYLLHRLPEKMRQDFIVQTKELANKLL